MAQELSHWDKVYEERNNGKTAAQGLAEALREQRKSYWQRIAEFEEKPAWCELIIDYEWPPSWRYLKWRKFVKRHRRILQLELKLHIISSDRKLWIPICLREN